MSVQDLNYVKYLFVYTDETTNSMYTFTLLTSAQQSHFVLNHCLTPSFLHSDEAFSLVTLCWKEWSTG